MTSSSRLFERSLAVAPGGVHSPVRAFRSVGGTPIFMAAARGAEITSVEGRTYIDFCQSFGPLILGHADPEVAAVVHEAIHDGWSFGTCEPYSLALAEWMVARLPWLERVRFVCSGTEAVMSALRVARAATGRPRILKFDGCYHGHVDAMLVRAGSGLAGQAITAGTGLPDETSATTLVAPLDDEAALHRIFARDGASIAAVILEPLPANHGLLIQRREFLRSVVATARQHGALVIFDEVISGFRVGRGGMAERLDVHPDLVTYGKVIGGGFPVGAYGGRRELMDQVAPLGAVYQAGTLSANPVGMRAGLATLQKLERVDGHRVLQERTRHLATAVNQRFADLGAPLTCVHEASLFWFRKVGDAAIRAPSMIAPDQAELFRAFFQACLAHGIYLAPSAYEVGFVSLAHTDEVLARALDGFAAAAAQAFARGGAS